MPGMKKQFSPIAKKMNIGGKVMGYDMGGKVMSENDRARMMEGVDGQVRGYTYGGAVTKKKKKK
jgi:hypothetical protein|tara:strand:- start:991 stop:1182 length:192 start_codon:yes stop_codon:yes gene_type:complete